MFRCLATFFLLLLLIAPQTSLSQGTGVEELHLTLPKDPKYKSVFTNRVSNTLISEFIPASQSLSNWKDMITTLIFFGGLNGTPKKFAKKFFANGRETCPESTGTILASGRTNGYPYTMFLLSCDQAAGTTDPEWNLGLAIKGRDSFFVVLKAWKHKPSDADMSFWRAYLAKIYVCDNRRAASECPF